MFEIPDVVQPQPRKKPTEEQQKDGAVLWDDTVPDVIRDRTEKTLEEKVEREQKLLTEYTTMIGLYETAKDHVVDIPLGDGPPSSVITAEVTKLVEGLVALSLFSTSDLGALAGQMERLFERGTGAFDAEIQKVQTQRVAAEVRIKKLQA